MVHKEISTRLTEASLSRILPSPDGLGRWSVKGLLPAEFNSYALIGAPIEVDFESDGCLYRGEGTVIEATGPLVTIRGKGLLSMAGQTFPHRLWIDQRDGRQARLGETYNPDDLVEIQCAGPGWPWHDADARLWGTTSGPDGPIWRVEQVPQPTGLVAVAELVHAAEMCADSTVDAVKGIGILIVRRAVEIARRQIAALAFSHRDMAAFLAWWDAAPGLDNAEFFRPTARMDGHELVFSTGRRIDIGSYPIGLHAIDWVASLHRRPFRGPALSASGLHWNRR